jgi:hypothetical protein
MAAGSLPEDATPGEPHRPGTGNTAGRVSALAFASEGKGLFPDSEDTPVLVWDVAAAFCRALSPELLPNCYQIL